MNQMDTTDTGLNHEEGSQIVPLSFVNPQTVDPTFMQPTKTIPTPGMEEAEPTDSRPTDVPTERDTTAPENINHTDPAEKPPPAQNKASSSTRRNRKLSARDPGATPERQPTVSVALTKASTKRIARRGGVPRVVLVAKHPVLQNACATRR